MTRKRPKLRVVRGGKRREGPRAPAPSKVTVRRREPKVIPAAVDISGKEFKQVRTGFSFMLEGLICQIEDIEPNRQFFIARYAYPTKQVVMPDDKVKADEKKEG